MKNSKPLMSIVANTSSPSSSAFTLWGDGGGKKTPNTQTTVPTSCCVQNQAQRGSATHWLGLHQAIEVVSWGSLQVAGPPKHPPGLPCLAPAAATVVQSMALGPTAAGLVRAHGA